MLGRFGIGAHQQEAPVGEMGARGPHLLPVDQEMIALIDGAGPEAGQIAAGAGFGEALAPPLLAGKMRGRWRFFCASVPHWMRVGPSRLMALGPGRIGARARKYSSSKMTCCIKLEPRPPYSLGQEIPTAGGMHLLLPGDAFFENIAIGATRWSAASSTLISAGSGFQPIAELGAEGRVLRAVGKIHDWHPPALPIFGRKLPLNSGYADRADASEKARPAPDMFGIGVPTR